MSTTLLIIIVVAVLLLGVASVFIDVYECGAKQRKISRYTARVASLLSKYQKNENFRAEATYIIAHSHEMSALFNDALHPTLTLASRLANNGLYGIEKYINEIGQDEIQTYQRLNNEKRVIFKQLGNPFTLFYRGIGFILRYIFGYLIGIINKDFDYEGIVWKTINLIVTLIASVFTIMTFFGYDWSRILSILNK